MTDTKRTPEVDRAAQVEAVVGLIESGSSENGACLEVGINRATFRAAAIRFQSGDKYARALSALAEDQIEKMELTIDDMRKGTIDAQQARVELDARKWFASKFLPRKYGEKIDLNHGGQPGNPVMMLIAEVDGTTFVPKDEDE